MKKLYTICLLTCFAVVSNAQRAVDLEVTEMLSPTQLNSAASGTPIQVTAVLKNNGPDSIQAGDSIAYQVVLRTSTDQLIVAIPNGSLYTRTMTRTLASGDTMHFRTSSFSINLKVNPSANVKLQFLGTALNRGTGGIATETAAQLANNLFTKSMVWYNEQGWGVGIGDMAFNSAVNVSPNPAMGQVRVSWLLNNTSDQSTELVMTDMTGREVLRKNVPSFTGQHILSLEGINPGLYIMEVRNGEYRHTARLNVGN